MKIYTPDNTASLNEAILWQYENAERLKALILAQQTFFEDAVTTFWDDYLDNIFNISTADSFGLRMWGIILGIQRPSYDVGGTPTTFSDEQYRLLLKSRVMLMRMNASSFDINKYLSFLFSGNPVFLYDNLDMTITYFFNYHLSDEDTAVLAIDGVLPRPTGVKAIVEFAVIDEPLIFGFSGQQLGQLNRSVFEVET